MSQVPNSNIIGNIAADVTMRSLSPGFSSSSDSSSGSDIMDKISPSTSEMSASSHNPSPQDLSQGILFSSVFAEHLEYLGVTVKEFELYPENVFNPGEDVHKAAAAFLLSLHEMKKVLIDDMQGNHSLVTHMLMRDVVNLSTVRQPSLRLSMCTNKKYNSCNKVGPITNKKTGNSLTFRGTLPNLVTRFEDTPDNTSNTFDSTDLSAKNHHFFVLQTFQGRENVYGGLTTAIAHALALSHVSRKEMVHFGVTDGRLWIFALLRRDQDTGGWTTLVYPLQDIQHISFSKSGEHTLQLPLVMEILLHWINGPGDKINKGKSSIEVELVSPQEERTKIPIPRGTILFSAATDETLKDLGVTVKSFTNQPRPTMDEFSDEEGRAIEEIFERLREMHKICFDEVLTTPPAALSVLLIGLVKVSAIRTPSHRLTIISNMIYDGFYKNFGVDNNLIPFKSARTGESFTLRGPANNAVIQYEDEPHMRLEGPPSIRDQFNPIYYPSFVFEASQDPSSSLSKSFPEAIAQGMAFCRCSQRDRVYFCVTDGRRWVFFLLCQSADNKQKWTAYHSEEHDAAWVPGEDGGRPNPHLRFVLQLLLEWVDGKAPNKKQLESRLE